MIGVICNYYIRNYGSVLQSLALQKTLNRLNIENEAINFQEQASKKNKIEILLKIRLKKLLDFKMITEKIAKKKDIVDNKRYIEILNKREEVFEKFINKQFDLSQKFQSKEDLARYSKYYKGILLGSDQLWCPSDLIIGYHTLEFLPDNVYKATYATSFGVEYLTPWMEKIVKNFIPKINDVSVREASGVKIIENVCRKKVVCMIDPTLLMTKEDWNTSIDCEKKIDGKYIFCYFLSTDTQMREWANRIKRITGYKLVFIPCLETLCSDDFIFADELIDDADPYEMVSLIRNAEYVLSDSFHTSVFSIIYGKKFLVFNRFQSNNIDSRNTRIDNLLAITGLQERNYNGEKDIFSVLDSSINYTDVWNQLSIERKKSLNYIKSTIGGKK